MSVLTIPSLRTGGDLSASSAKRSKDNDGLQHEIGAFDDDDEDHHSGQPSHQEQKPGRAKPGRKMVNSEPQDKKIAQQRAASRAFRERKANYIKELEQKVADLSAQLASSAGSGPQPQQQLPAPQYPDPILAQRVATLEAENTLLRQMTFSFDFKALNNYVSPTPVLPDLSGLLAANASLNALAAAGSSQDQMQQMQIQMQMQMQASLLSQLQAAQQQLLPLQQQQHQQQQQPIHPLLATAISPAISSDDSFSVLLQSSSASPDPSFFLPTASASTSTTTSLYKSSPVASPAAGAPTQPPNASSFAAGNLDFSSLLDFSSYREASSTPPFDATGGSLYEEGGTGGRDSADLFDELNKMEQAQSPPLDAASSAGAGAQDKMVTKEVIQCTKIVKEELKTVTSLSPEDVAALCGEFQKCSTNAQKEGVTMNLCKDYNPDHQHLLNMQQKIMGKVHNEADKHKVQSILATAAGKMREKVELAALGFATTILD